MTFEKAKWIWRQGGSEIDEFVDFVCAFRGGEGKWSLNISADSDYTVYINGRLAAFGQYADYPSYKVYDSVDVSDLVVDGDNHLCFTVWYYGVDSQTYVKGKAGLIFELFRDGETVAYSSPKTLSRLSAGYVSGRCKTITSQLGLSYRYDAVTAEQAGALLPSAVCEARAVAQIPRPIKKLVLQKPVSSRVVRCGSYKYSDPNAPSEIRMRDAELFDVPPASLPASLVRQDGCDGIFVVVDVGGETAGFLELDLWVPSSAEIDVGYGEHLLDGRCRTRIGNRAFSVEYLAASGDNKFLGTFRRLGGRYLQIFVPSSTLVLNYLGLRPTVYPITDVGRRPSDDKRKRIYDVAVNTLVHCMHEHYEDCPWREQALYTMDSRNQMLCGYYAFGEYEFARASLKLISKGVRDDGLLSLCYPAGLDFPIPAFSLMYFVQMWEYVKYSGDSTLACELYGMMKQLMGVFVVRIEANGLIKSFPSHWNFYEWSDGMSGSMKKSVVRFEAPLNGFLSLGIDALANISEALGEYEDARVYRGMSRRVADGMRSYFYRREIGLFASYDECDRYSVLTNALCLLCGAADGVDKSHILKILCNNKGDDCGPVIVPNTLSMNSFRFDALLAEDKKYASAILDEIDREYGYMLEQGATAFWETIQGAADFGGAGSLCHGWSALPIYYYSILDDSTFC